MARKPNHVIEKYAGKERNFSSFWSHLAALENYEEMQGPEGDRLMTKNKSVLLVIKLIDPEKAKKSFQRLFTLLISSS